MDANKKLRETVITKMQSGDFEIKPCPFCGGQPIMMNQETFEYLKNVDGDGKACFSLDCPKCNLNFYDHTHDEQDYYIRAFLITEKWNRRAE